MVWLLYTGFTVIWFAPLGTPSVCKYVYIVRIISPKKKSSYVVRSWHQVHDRFESPEVMKAKLKVSFKDCLPGDSLDFNIGYFEKRGNGKLDPGLK